MAWYGMVWIYTRTRADTTSRELKRRSHGTAPIGRSESTIHQLQIAGLQTLFRASESP